MKKELDKWQFVFTFGPDIRTMEPGWRLVEFGILKITSYPGQGWMLSKEHYQGFLIRFMVWLPFKRAW